MIKSIRLCLSYANSQKEFPDRISLGKRMEIRGVRFR
jgi:hypothetical protein